MDARFCIKMIKFELAIIDRARFIIIKRVYFCFIKPVFAGILIILKYIVVIPIGRLSAKLFPELVQKKQEEHKNPK